MLTTDDTVRKPLRPRAQSKADQDLELLRGDIVRLDKEVLFVAMGCSHPVTGRKTEKGQV